MVEKQLPPVVEQLGTYEGQCLVLPATGILVCARVGIVFVPLLEERAVILSYAWIRVLNQLFHLESRHDATYDGCLEQGIILRLIFVVAYPAGQENLSCNLAYRLRYLAITRRRCRQHACERVHGSPLRYRWGSVSKRLLERGGCRPGLLFEVAGEQAYRRVEYRRS